ncbi:MAG: glycosyl hydrolase-related protein, partial [Verrucomicrobiales bacterium]|nr:glycosyl hydrolase-related protein [Verrucomicrobiales bacterium]
WLGGRAYPLERLTNAWTLVMGGQFHDNLPGTATPKAYEFAWNDQVLALNQFAGVLTSATEAIASGMNTQTRGTAIVVYNPLSVNREDIVEAEVPYTGGMPKGVRVVGPNGRPVPAQLLSSGNGVAKALFVATVPSVGFAVYDVQLTATTTTALSALKVTGTSLENLRYRLHLDENGDVSSIYDKKLKRELLRAPARLAFQLEKPKDWPAWNMDWRDQQKPPRSFVQGPAKVRITERGPVRVALEIGREAEGSRFVQTIRLSAGDAGNRVEFGNVIDWRTPEAALKATFRLTASNPLATYNWDVGTVQRSNNDPKKYEVPSHQWIDLTDKSGAFGVTVLSDCKIGSDKPDDSTLRLTLLYTPGIGEGNGRFYSDQSSQDWGRHEFIYGLIGHAGDRRQEQTDWQAYRLNQPLMAFESPKHAGALGRSFSLLELNNSRVRVLALKKAEESDEFIIRLVEIDGKPAPNVRAVFAAPVRAAREVTGQEQPLGPATVTSGALVTDLGPYQLRTFAVRFAPAPARVAAPQSLPVPLPYDRSVASLDGVKSSAGFSSDGRSLPAEMLPNEVAYAGIRFTLGPSRTGQPNAVVPRGQTIQLPAGNFNRLFILAAAEGDQRATFRIDNQPMELTIQDWTGFIGQWDNRSWNRRQEPIPPRPGAPTPPPGTPPRMRTVLEFTGQISPGYVKRAPVAWFASHRHTADGVNEPYAFSYLYAYTLDLPPHAKSLTLPDNDRLRVLAVTVAQAGGQVRPAQPLYDTLERPQSQELSSPGNTADSWCAGHQENATSETERLRNQMHAGCCVGRPAVWF